jgi:hypothetical protein
MILVVAARDDSTGVCFLRNGGTGMRKKQARKILTQQCFGSRGKNAKKKFL